MLQNVKRVWLRYPLVLAGHALLAGAAVAAVAFLLARPDPGPELAHWRAVFDVGTPEEARQQVEALQQSVADQQAAREKLDKELQALRQASGGWGAAFPGKTPEAAAQELVAARKEAAAAGAELAPWRTAFPDKTPDQVSAEFAENAKKVAQDRAAAEAERDRLREELAPWRTAFPQNKPADVRKSLTQAEETAKTSAEKLAQWEGAFPGQAPSAVKEASASDREATSRAREMLAVWQDAFPDQSAAALKKRLEAAEQARNKLADWHEAFPGKGPAEVVARLKGAGESAAVPKAIAELSAERDRRRIELAVLQKRLEEAEEGRDELALWKKTFPGMGPTVLFEAIKKVRDRRPPRDADPAAGGVAVSEPVRNELDKAGCLDREGGIDNVRLQRVLKLGVSLELVEYIEFVLKPGALLLAKVEMRAGRRTAHEKLKVLQAELEHEIRKSRDAAKGLAPKLDPHVDDMLMLFLDLVQSRHGRFMYATVIGALRKGLVRGDAVDPFVDSAIDKALREMLKSDDYVEFDPVRNPFMSNGAWGQANWLAEQGYKQPPNIEDGKKYVSYAKKMINELCK